jgi:hypothetical protein
MAKGSFDPPQSRRASAPARNASPSRSSAVEEIWTSWRYAKATAGAERAATIGSFRSAIGLRAVTLGRQIFSDAAIGQPPVARVGTTRGLVEQNHAASLVTMPVSQDGITSRPAGAIRFSIADQPPKKHVLQSRPRSPSHQQHKQSSIQRDPG